MTTNDMDLGVPPLSNKDQLHLLRQQLEQQQAILNQLQQGGAGRGGVEVRGAGSKLLASSASNEARRAPRKVATAKHRAQVSELEGRLSSISSVHVALTAENGMLRRRLLLLESGVQMREQHIEALARGRLQRQQQQPREHRLTIGADRGEGVREASTSGHDTGGKDDGSWASFGQFPDSKSWNPDTCR